jgi:hypothetical protein
MERARRAILAVSLSRRVFAYLISQMWKASVPGEEPESEL